MWLSNPYRVHQRIAVACEGDNRFLFRIESDVNPITILVQSHVIPQWERSFDDLAVLSIPAEWKVYQPKLQIDYPYQFRLLANPTVKRDGKRLGILEDDQQKSWLKRKLEDSGAQVLECHIKPQGLQRSQRNSVKDPHSQTHLAVQFDGVLKTSSPRQFWDGMQAGFGSAKGYGFGLLTLAQIR
jgi:CRISPR system Cascade subunit CasE